jgi:outer membrane cobalamin receptor
MDPSRCVWLAAACRLVLVFAAVASVATRPLAAQDAVGGVVLDPSGRPVPRAYVRASSRAGEELAAGFADENGRFRLTVANIADCRIVASLAGFQPAVESCAPARTLRLRLALAPVHEAVLVSATRTEAPTSQVGASATVFTAEDLQRRQQPLLADLLRRTPGAMVVRSGAPGAQTSLFVRGGESNYNKVLLDGVPLNEPGGTFYFNHLTTQDLERVEIIRGAYSSLFGSDAMASVVHLFTRRGEAGSGPRAHAQVDGGTHGTWHASTSVSGAAGPIDYSLGAARYASDDGTPNSGFNNSTLTANAGVRLTADATLRVVARTEFERVGTPGQTAFGRPDLDAFFDRDDAVLSVGFDQAITGGYRQRASYGLASSAQTSTNLTADPPFTAAFGDRTASFPSTDFTFDSFSRLRRHHASYQGDWRLGADERGAHILTLLADWDGERALLENRLSPDRITAARDNMGFSVQHQMLWPRLFATVGGRLERNENFGTAVVPRGTIVVVARESTGRAGDLRVKASGGRGIKEPTILQSFSPSPYFRGNPNLEPERARSVEIGIEQRLAGNRVKLEATWFDNRYQDIISLRTTDPATYEGQYFNVGLTSARGLEVAATGVPGRALEVRTGYTFLDSEILESTSPFDEVFRQGQWAFRRPRHSGYAGMTLVWDRLTAEASGVFVGRYVDSDFGLFTPPLYGNMNPGHTVWDADVTYRFTARVSAIFTVDNLADADYMEPFGYRPYGRIARAGLRLDY